MVLVGYGKMGEGMQLLQGMQQLVWGDRVTLPTARLEPASVLQECAAAVVTGCQR